jgi:hypothetical protein
MPDEQLVLSREAMHLLRFNSVDGAITFLRARGLSPIVRGRSYLWRRAEVLALLTSAKVSP